MIISIAESHPIFILQLSLGHSPYIYTYTVTSKGANIKSEIDKHRRGEDEAGKYKHRPNRT